MTIADYISVRLKDYGVSAVFSLTGGLCMFLTDALHRAGIRQLFHHHESHAVIAADGYARQSGKLGVVLVTGGPGATNTITALTGAYQDSSPVLVLAGQCRTTSTRRNYTLFGVRQFGTFEVDILPMVEPVTKYAARVDRMVQVQLDQAIATATSGRPGPVFLEVPLDVQEEEYREHGYYFPTVRESFDNVNPAQLHAMLEASQKAQRPLILAGYGVRVAGKVDAFQAWVERLGCPVVTTQFGKDVLYYDHQQFVGHIGIRGDQAAANAVKEADFILAVGCSMHEQTVGYDPSKFAPQAVKFIVEPDKAVIQRAQVIHETKRLTNAHWLNCGMEAVVGVQVGLSHNVCYWLKQCQEWKHQYPATSSFRTESNLEDMYATANRLSEALPDDCTIITDSGCSWYIMGQALRLKKGQRFLSSGSLGSMGWAMPAATGAALAGSKVVVITGDGSFHMAAHELSVWRRHKLPIILYVLDNGGYSCIRRTQNQFCGNRHIGIDFPSGMPRASVEYVSNAYGWIINHVHCRPDQEFFTP